MCYREHHLVFILTVERGKQLLGSQDDRVRWQLTTGDTLLDLLLHLLAQNLLSNAYADLIQVGRTTLDRVADV